MPWLRNCGRCGNIAPVGGTSDRGNHQGACLLGSDMPEEFLPTAQCGAAPEEEDFTGESEGMFRFKGGCRETYLQEFL